MLTGHEVEVINYTCAQKHTQVHVCLQHPFNSRKVKEQPTVHVVHKHVPYMHT